MAARYGFTRTLDIVERGVDALTLGLFSDASIDALTARFYSSSPHYAGDEHNLRGLLEWEAAAVVDHFPPRGRVLVTSAGAGREALALVARGYEVVATECVPALHARLCANLETAPSATVLLAPPDFAPAGPFSACVLGWSAYTHLAGRTRREAFLARLAMELAPGAPVLISYLGVPRHGRGARAAAALATTLRAPFGGRPIEVGETTLPSCFYRFYAPGEVAAEVQAAGYRVVRDAQYPYHHIVALAPE